MLSYLICCAALFAQTLMTSHAQQLRILQTSQESSHRALADQMRTLQDQQVCEPFRFRIALRTIVIFTCYLPGVCAFADQTLSIHYDGTVQHQPTMCCALGELGYSSGAAAGNERAFRDCCRCAVTQFGPLVSLQGAGAYHTYAEGAHCGCTRKHELAHAYCHFS